MEIAAGLPVEQYLIHFAVGAYIDKYGFDLSYENCTIQSIRASWGYEYGYRIDTLRGDDHVVLHLYFNSRDVTKLHVIRGEVVQNLYGPNSLIDELTVITADLSHEEYTYRFPWIEGEWSNYDLVFYEDGDYACFEDGSAVLWEGAS